MSQPPEKEAHSMEPRAERSRWATVKAAARSTRGSSKRAVLTSQHVPAGAHTPPPILRPELSRR